MIPLWGAIRASANDTVSTRRHAATSTTILAVALVPLKPRVTYHGDLSATHACAAN